MINYRKNIHLYYDFFTAATYKNLNLAAAVLGISESTVCRSIHRLERLKLEKLIIGDRNGITLTEAGEKLYEELHAIFCV